MLTTEKPKTKPTRDLGKMLSTRGGTLAIAGITALLAGAVLMVFLNRYRESTGGDDAAATVLVAKKLIERGSLGAVLAEEELFTRTTTTKGELKKGAISDPSALQGKVAVDDVYPGQQLTANDFTAAAPRILNRLKSEDRGISVALDSSHGMFGDIQSGDRVDVLVGFNAAGQGTGRGRPVIKKLMRNVLVLRAAGGPGGGNNVVLRAPDGRAAELAYAADNGRIWLVLRPQAGARDSKVDIVTLETLLFRERPITVDGSTQPGEDR
jgi:Flp pilus assembly protein CpaB